MKKNATLLMELMGLSRRGRYCLGGMLCVALFLGDAQSRAAEAARAPGAPVASPSASPSAQKQPVQKQPVQSSRKVVNLSPGKAVRVALPRPATDFFIADDKIADLRVVDTRSVDLFGISRGETTFYARDENGAVVYETNVRVGRNLDNVNEMLTLAMPNADITVTPLTGMVLLQGDVASPGDVAEAERLVKTYLGPKEVIINRLTASAPAQVNLRVKFAEVSRTIIKELGVNLASFNNDVGVFQSRRNFYSGNPTAGIAVTPKTGSTSISIFKNILGLDLLSVIDLLETNGHVTLLAEPNITAISGETASFLAGGEYPIPTVSQNGQVNILFKEYGVNLSFTPTVMGRDRISLRVRPEVSELSETGAVTVDGITIPALLTRRADTMVELASGESFMIAGLLRNRSGLNVDKAPFLGDIPVLGALFRSERFRRAETELVIIITAYLVRPITSDKVALPTTGHNAVPDWRRWLMGDQVDVDGAPPVQHALDRVATEGTSSPAFLALPPKASPKTPYAYSARDAAAPQKKKTSRASGGGGFSDIAAATSQAASPARDRADSAPQARRRLNKSRRAKQSKDAESDMVSPGFSQAPAMPGGKAQ